MSKETLLKEFEEIKPLGLTPDDKLVHLEEGDKRVLRAYQQQIRLFLKDSLTSMLDEIEDEQSELFLCEEFSMTEGECGCCEPCRKRKEVINIINSHR